MDGIDGTNNLSFPKENELNGETALGLDGEKVFSPEKVVTRKLEGGYRCPVIMGLAGRWRWPLLWQSNGRNRRNKGFSGK